MAGPYDESVEQALRSAGVGGPTPATGDPVDEALRSAGVGGAAAPTPAVALDPVEGALRSAGVGPAPATGDPVDEALRSAGVGQGAPDSREDYVPAAYFNKLGKAFTDRDAPSTDPEAFKRAGERVTEALPSDLGEFTRGVLRAPGTPTGALATTAQWVASNWADEPGVARKVWEALSGEDWVDPKTLDRMKAAGLAPEVEQEIRRRQATFASLPDQAADIKRGLLDLPIQFARGAGNMVDDVRRGEPGDALMRPATTLATVGGEMARSMIKTGQGQTAGREIGVALALVPGTGAGARTGKALASGLGARHVATETAKGLLVGDAEVEGGLLQAMKDATGGSRLLSAQFPGATKEMVTDTRFETAARVGRGLGDLEATRALDPEMLEAVVTQGEEAVPMAREWYLAQKETDEIYQAALENEATAKMANDAMEGVPFDEIRQNPQAMQAWRYNYKQELKTAQDKARLAEELNEVIESIPEAANLANKEAAILQERVRSAENTKSQARDIMDRADARARSSAEGKQLKVFKKTSKEAGDAWARAGERLGVVQKARAADRSAWQAQDALEHTTGPSRRFRPGITEARKTPWPSKDRNSMFLDGLGPTDARDFDIYGHATIGAAVKAGRDAESMGTVAGLLDPINELLGRRGNDRFINPREAWVALSKEARTVDELRDAAAAMREVPGFEDFNPIQPGTHLFDLELEELGRRRVLDQIDDAQQRHRSAATRRGDYNQQQRRGEARGRIAGRAKAGEDAAFREASRAKAKLGRIQEGGPVPLTRGHMQASRSFGRADEAGRQLVKRQRRKRDAAVRDVDKLYRKAGRLRSKIDKTTAKRWKAKASDVVDPGRASIAALEGVDRTGGARLMLGDEALNTPKAALLDLNDVDMRKAMDSGDLRYTHPDSHVETLLNEAVLPMVVRINEMGKEKLALGIPGVGVEQLRVQATNYVRAYYDAAQAKKFKLASARQNIADYVEETTARVSSGELHTLEAHELIRRKLERELSDIPAVEHKSIGRQFGIFGKTDMGSMRRASSKFKRARDEQFERGRWDASMAQESLARQMVEQNRTIANHKLFRNLAKTEHVFPGDVDDLAEGGRLTDKVLLRVREGIPVYKTSDGKAWAKMPSSRERWGDLAGRLVDADLAKRLTEINKLEAGLYSKLLSMWKANKVVNNFSSQFHVAVGNTLNQVLDGGKPTDMARVWRDYTKSDGWVHQATRDAGLYEGLVMDVELDLVASNGGVLKTLERMYADAKFYGETTGRLETMAEMVRQSGWRDASRLTVDFGDLLTNKVAGFGGLAKRLFTAQEMLSRMAILKRSIVRQAKELKIPEGQMAEFARRPEVLKRARQRVMEVQLDYGDLPDWAQVARGTGAVPFISYPFKATGLFMRSMVSMPRRFKGVVAGERAAYMLSPEEEKKRRDMSPEYKRLYNVPLTDTHDVDIQYASPFVMGPLTAMNPRVEGLDQGRQGLIPPHLRWVDDIINNNDGFRNEPIWDPVSDDPSTMAMKATWHILTSMGPGWLNRANDNIVPAFRGEANAHGQDLSRLESIIYTMGVRAAKKDLSRPWVEAEFKRLDYEAFKTRKWRRGLLKRSLTPGEVKKETQDLVDLQMRILREATKERMR